MKQITLETPAKRKSFGGICTGRLVMLWGLYGWSVAMLWRLAESDPWAQVFVWGLALLAGLALSIPMLEV